MLNSERERLVESFRSSREMEVIQLLAVVHAMCMYQIIGFFDGDVGQVVAAREKNGAFLEMGKRLVRMVSGGGMGWGDWAEWRVWESVVRTVHVVHAINVISTRQNGGVYEPLDREAVLDLPLPCEGDVWRATTGVEWARARRKKGDMEVLTMRKLVGDEMALKQFISGLDGDNDQKKFQDCDDLVKLILASVEI